MDLFNLIFPKRCLGCGNIGQYFCTKCNRTIRKIEINETICPVCDRPAVNGATHPRCRTRYTLDGLTSFFRYDRVVKKAVKTIKYRFVSDLASEFIGLISSDLFPSFISHNKSDILVPIPLHPTRYRFRGFNQAEVLGKILAKRLDISIKTDLLQRIKKTTPQVEMKDREKRLDNMKNVFAIDRITLDFGSNIILFDDVFTTGATLRSAANALKRTGFKKVWGMTMAR